MREKTNQIAKSPSKLSKKDTIYKITILSGAQDDFANLDPSLQQRTLKQLEKLKKHPHAGDPCGNKNNLDLSGFFKLKFNRTRHRIVYKILDGEKEIEVWGIGKRESMAIYRMVASRLSDIQLQFGASGLQSISGQAELKKQKKSRR